MTTEFLKVVVTVSGLSYKDFSEKINVNPKTLSRWNKGINSPDFVNQKAIRSVFKNEVKYANELISEI